MKLAMMKLRAAALWHRTGLLRWFRAALRLGVAFLLPGFSLAARAAQAPERPNIVVIYADDWGWGDLKCQGHPSLQTPNLDRLARQGIRFTQANVLNPVCSPSRTALMTGQFPARWGVHEHFAHPDENRRRGMPDWLDPKAPSLPRLLRSAGYRTGHFGKWHLTNRQTRGAPPCSAYGIDESAVFNGGADFPEADLHATASNAVAFIRANRSRPFYVNVWLHEAHTPHVPTEASMEKWKHLPMQQRVYAAVITDGDNDVGQVLGALQDLNLERNTIVIFSSDNGPEWTGSEAQKRQGPGYGTHFSVGSTGGLRGRKRSLFEGGVRVPFIVRWPERTPAGQVDETTSIAVVDLLPTLCHAAGVGLPADYRPDGEDMLPALLGRPMRRSKPLFWEWRGGTHGENFWPRLAVRDGDWKLCLAQNGRRESLFNVVSDREESKDVAAEHPDVVKKLSKMLLDWRETLPKNPPADCISTGRTAKQ